MADNDNALANIAYIPTADGGQLAVPASLAQKLFGPKDAALVQDFLKPQPPPDLSALTFAGLRPPAPVLPPLPTAAVDGGAPLGAAGMSHGAPADYAARAAQGFPSFTPASPSPVTPAPSLPPGGLSPPLAPLATGARAGTSPAAPSGVQKAFDVAAAAEGKAIGSQTQATVDAANAEADARAQMQQHQQGLLAQQAQAEAARQARVEAGQKKLETSIAEVSKPLPTVDPSRWWASRTTPQKVMGVLGLALGGFASGLKGGPNVALQMIQHAIDTDVEAQKTNVANTLAGRQQNLAAQSGLYKTMLERFGDDRQAEAATRTASWQLAGNQLEALMAKTKAPLAQAQGQALMAGLQQKQAEQAQSFHQQNVLNSFKGREVAVQEGELGVKQAEVGVKQANRGDLTAEQLQKQAQDYGKDFTDASQMDKSLAVLMKAAGAGGDIPGVGAFDSNVPAALNSQKDDQVQQAVKQTLSSLIKQRSGSVASDEEVKRLAGAYGLNGNEAQFREGVKALNRDVRTEHQNIQAKYDPRAVALHRVRLRGAAPSSQFDGFFTPK